ncbi:MAG: hypothetical protein DMF73_16695 [Acidobacteria bacterium]|nr:MAG: hypothetical protein DMF73_16695 [Acidobacteriota bacterium]
MQRRNRAARRHSGDRQLERADDLVVSRSAGVVYQITDQQIELDQVIAPNRVVALVYHGYAMTERLEFLAKTGAHVVTALDDQNRAGCISVALVQRHVIEFGVERLSRRPS